MNRRTRRLCSQYCLQWDFSWSRDNSDSAKPDNYCRLNFCSLKGEVTWKDLSQFEVTFYEIANVPNCILWGHTNSCEIFLTQKIENELKTCFDFCKYFVSPLQFLSCVPAHKSTRRFNGKLVLVLEVLICCYGARHCQGQGGNKYWDHNNPFQDVHCLVSSIQWHEMPSFQAQHCVNLPSCLDPVEQTTTFFSFQPLIFRWQTV